MSNGKTKICILLTILILIGIAGVFAWRYVSQGSRLDQVKPGVEDLVPVTQPSVTDPEETTIPQTLETTIPTTPSEETMPPKQTMEAVPQYYQNDYPEEPYGYDTVANSGSNMAALAMVASFLTDHSYYPDEIADDLAHFMGGDYQRLEYGSDLLQLAWERAENVHRALEAIQDGKIAIFLMNKNSIFTWKDHYVVVTGVNEDGSYTVMDTNRDYYSKDSLKQRFETGFSAGDLTQGYRCAWIYDKSAMPEEPFLYVPEPPAEQSRYPGLELTQEEKDLLAKLICREAASEPFEGQQAVAEVVLNRLASGRFQSTVYNIVHAPGQFPSVPYLYKAKPDYTQYKAIEQALNGPYVLPEDVYFYATFRVNDNYWGQIGNHYFCYGY